MSAIALDTHISSWVDRFIVTPGVPAYDKKMHKKETASMNRELLIPRIERGLLRGSNGVVM